MSIRARPPARLSASSRPGDATTRHLAARRQWLAIVAAIAAASVGLLARTPPARAAAFCGLAGRVDFAGHTLPLDGPPDPPTMTTVDAFPSLPAFTYPVFLTGAGDGTDRLFVVEQGGEIKVFPNDPAADANDLTVYMYLQGSVAFTPGGETGLLGLAFDPAFESNGALYVNYTTYLDPPACGAQPAIGTRVERIVVPDPTANFVSVPEMVRTPLVEFCQPNVNHNGGMLAFGPDGMLYVSTGDGGGGPDTAYDLSTPLGSILRIDPTDGSAPPDNPFVGVPGADPRIYHLGLRNPWRFSFDRAAPHDLWIGDVGQDNWEEIDRVPFSPGGVDFGWPACEGTHDYNGTCGARGDIPPVIELPHIDSYSITGGYVYRGPGLPELTGLYVFGDFGTGRIWAWDGVTVDPGTGDAVLIDLAAVNNAASFGEDDAGELYVADYATGRIRRFAAGSGGGGFPTLLSQTGLFADTVTLSPAPGLVEYDVRSPLWSDRALKRRWLALPAGSQVDPTLEDAWSFPIGTVFVKHFELPVAPGQTRRLETRLFIHQLVGWTGVTYRWNEAETDATLLTTALADVIPVVENGQSFDQTWQYPSPAGCLACHTVASGRVLGVRTAQLNRTFPYPAGDDEQLDAWSCSGILSESYGGQPGLAAHAALDDTTASLQQRARAYFDSNCSMCHQPGGTAPGGIDMRSRVLLGDMHLIGVAPNQGDLGLPSPERIKPGVSAESVLHARMAASDPAVRMASGTLLVHDEALSVVGSWIDTGLSIIDTDEDGVADAADLCPGVPDPGQADRDGDLLGDACDPDDAPDLIAVASGPAQAGAGQVLSVSGTVDNGGLRTAMSSQVRLYLSLDTAFDAGVDALVGDCQSGAVAPGGTMVCADTDAQVPADLLPPGTTDPVAYYWLACADALDVVAETDDANNCAPAQQVVMVPEPGGGTAPLAGLVTLVCLARRRRMTRRRESRVPRAGAPRGAGHGSAA